MIQRIDDNFNSIATNTQQLSTAISTGRWSEVENSLGNLITRLLNTNPESVFAITPIKKQEREVFVFLHGIQSILLLFQKPFCETDARLITSTQFSRRSEVWNEILVILREVTYAIPTLSDQIFDSQHIVFFFTLLHHHSVFENAMNLLEEVLSSRLETFNLSLIPRIYSLISNFSVRQFAHFCRVLSLVIFEPEDRQIMEGYR
jgi:hypothetical protein